MTIRVGQAIPDLSATAYVRGESQAQEIKLADYRGQWLVLFFYPRDFTFVSPTAFQSLARLHADFTQVQAVVLGASTDSYFVHKAWYEADERLKTVDFPVLADTSHELSRAFDVLLDDGAALRGTFVVDPEGTLRHAQVNDLDVGRNVDETLR